MNCCSCFSWRFPGGLKTCRTYIIYVVYISVTCWQINVFWFKLHLSIHSLLIISLAFQLITWCLQVLCVHPVVAWPPAYCVGPQKIMSFPRVCSLQRVDTRCGFTKHCVGHSFWLLCFASIFFFFQEKI